MFARAGCNACYVGETVRHISTRVKEHLSSIRSSCIFKHLQNRPFYSYLLGELAFDWRRGWRWPCFYTDFSSAFVMWMHLVSIRTSWLTKQKQWGLCQNKVTSSLVAIQKPGRWAHIRKMFHSEHCRILGVTNCFHVLDNASRSFKKRLFTFKENSLFYVNLKYSIHSQTFTLCLILLSLFITISIFLLRKYHNL